MKARSSSTRLAEQGLAILVLLGAAVVNLNAMAVVSALAVLCGNYPALAGCALFLLYPVWRTFLLRRATQRASVDPSYDFGDDPTNTVGKDPRIQTA
jgi:uncharacterized membrane protein YccC